VKLTYLLSRGMHTTTSVSLCVFLCDRLYNSQRLSPNPLLQLQQLWPSRSDTKVGGGGGGGVQPGSAMPAGDCSFSRLGRRFKVLQINNHTLEL
jgi:hypothetical protein